MFEKSGVSSKKCSCMFLDKSSTSCRKSVTSIRSFGNDAGFLEWFLFIEILNASSTSFWIFLMILSSLNPLVSVVIKKNKSYQNNIRFFPKKFLEHLLSITHHHNSILKPPYTLNKRIRER